MEYWGKKCEKKCGFAKFCNFRVNSVFNQAKDKEILGFFSIFCDLRILLGYLWFDRYASCKFLTFFNFVVVVKNQAPREKHPRLHWIAKHSHLN